MSTCSEEAGDVAEKHLQREKTDVAAEPLVEIAEYVNRLKKRT